jgi:hypothetical protein
MTAVGAFHDSTFNDFGKRNYTLDRIKKTGSFWSKHAGIAEYV